MTFYGVASIETKEKDLRDRAWFRLYGDEASQKRHIQNECALGGIPYKRYLRSMASDGGMSLSWARKSGHYLVPFTCELEDAQKSYSMAKSAPLSPDSMEAQMVFALRQQAKAAKGPYLKGALRCMATCIDNYARYGRKDSTETVLEEAAYLSRKHISAPCRKAFQKARTLLARCVRRYEKDVCMRSDPMYGKGGCGW